MKPRLVLILMSQWSRANPPALSLASLAQKLDQVAGMVMGFQDPTMQQIQSYGTNHHHKTEITTAGNNPAATQRETRNNDKLSKQQSRDKNMKNENLTQHKSRLVTCQADR